MKYRAATFAEYRRSPCGGVTLKHCNAIIETIAKREVVERAVTSSREIEEPRYATAKSTVVDESGITSRGVIAEKNIRLKSVAVNGDEGVTRSRVITKVDDSSVLQTRNEILFVGRVVDDTSPGKR